MNKKIVDRLWLVSKKMRGTFEMEDLCRVTIYTFFLKYVEMKSKEEKNLGYNDTFSFPAYDDRFSVEYLSFTYGNIVRRMDLMAYVNEMEKALELENGIICRDFGRLLEVADDNTIRTILGEVAQIDFENTDRLYDVSMMLLNKLANENGRMSCDYISNLSLCKLERELLNCKENMSVYDAFCGCGGSVNEVANKNGIVFLQDVNANTLALATVIAILSGNKIGQIGCGDSQLNPLSDAMYDRIVCEPPFLPRYSREYLESVPQGNCIYQESLDSESLALRHCLAHLKEDGIAVVLVPMGFLFKSGKGAEVRARLIRDKYIDAVIELPSGILVSTAVATAFLVLKKNKTDDRLFMVNTKSFFEKIDKSQIVISEENISKIVEMYKNRKVIDGISNNVSVHKLEENGYNLCTTQYVTLSLEDTIEIEDNSVYVQKYNQLVMELKEIDNRLEFVRGRFVKGN